jgi:hypothetical protein
MKFGRVNTATPKQHPHHTSYNSKKVHKLEATCWSMGRFGTKFGIFVSNCPAAPISARLATTPHDGGEFSTTQVVSMKQAFFAGRESFENNH